MVRLYLGPGYQAHGHAHLICLKIHTPPRGASARPELAYYRRLSSDGIFRGGKQMFFKHLTHRDGKSVTVNLDLVRYMTPEGTENHTILSFDGDGKSSITVRETIKQILIARPDRRTV